MSDDSLRAPDQPRLTRVLLTPVGDLLRGRITGPIARAPRAPRAPRGYRAVVLDAKLPWSLADLTLRVTAHTRLRRREKTDVARELVAHFRDGLGAGQSADALAAAFGNPIQAARLIRRAKKRNRSLLWHAWVNTWKTIGAVVLLCAAIYAVLAVRYWTGHPTIKRNLAAELNAPALAVPESERAWPVYRRAYLALPVMPQAIMDSDRWPAVEPDGPDWPVYLAYVDSAQETIGLLRQAAAMPHMGFLMSDAMNDHEVLAHSNVIRGHEPFDGGPPPPIVAPSENPPALTLLLPNLGLQRELARHLAADARVALSRSEGDRFVSDINALLGLAHHAGEHPVLIAKLVGAAIAVLAVDTTGRALADRADLLSEPQLIALAHRFGAMPVEIDVGVERLFFEDTVQRMYSDDGRGGGRLVVGEALNLLHRGDSPASAVLKGAGGPILSALAVGRWEVVREWDRLMGITRDEAAMPMWTWTAAPGEREISRVTKSKWYNVRYFPLPALIPAIGRVTVTSNTAAMRRDGVTAAIALELWRRSHGSYPATLDDMTPDLLPAIPIDRFDGAPLRYHVDAAGRPVIYSVGMDRDDDGGRPTAAENPDATASQWAPIDHVARNLADAKLEPLYNGDWVLWPPLR
jgi:hypothetical protein